MPKQYLKEILQKASLKDLHDFVEIKETIDKLEARKAAIERELIEINDALGKIFEKLPDLGIELPPKKRRGRRTRAEAMGVQEPPKRPKQPPLAELVKTLLRENGEPMPVDEIVDVLLNEKRYRTKSTNFISNLRVLLYHNKKGYFRRVSPGVFDLVAEEEADGETVVDDEPAPRPILRKASRSEEEEPEASDGQEEDSGTSAQ